MKNIKKLVAAVMVCSFLFALAGCTKKWEIKAYDEDEYMEILEDKLGIDEDDIDIFDNLGHRGSELIEGTYIQTHYGNCSIFISLFDHDSDAEDTFDSMLDQIDEFEDDSDRHELFEENDGELAYHEEDDTGYILCRSNEYFMPSFGGDINMRREDCYVAAFYCDDVIVRIIPHNEYEKGDSEQIIEIIEAFGYPTLEDVNG